MNDARLKNIDNYFDAIDDSHFEQATPAAPGMARELITALRESQAEVTRLREALQNIVYFVHPNRERDWHLYPTRLRDAAVALLPDCKTYAECEETTREALASKAEA